MIYIMQSSKVTEPIREFKTNRQFQECAKWWKKKLLLESWLITFELRKEELHKDDGSIIDGYCQFIFENKEAKIVISDYNIEDTFLKHCSELTLVHELLHLKTEYLPQTYASEKEEDIVDLLLHQSQETMAKTLIMAKYNIEYEWFLK